MARRRRDRTWLDESANVSLTRQDVVLVESLLWSVQEAPVVAHLVRDRAYSQLLNEALNRLVPVAAEIRAELARRSAELEAAHASAATVRRSRPQR